LENGDETHVTVDEGEVSEPPSHANDAVSLNESVPSEHISEDHVGESLTSDRREMVPAPLYVQYSSQVKSNRHSRFSASTWRSSLSSLGNLLPRRSFAQATRPPPGLFDVGSLDDYDLSDSDDSAKNDRQRRLVRRMPQRRDFQFVRQSLESMSSTGLQSSKSESERLSSHSHDGDDRAAIPLQDVQPWQLRYTRDDSDDEPGDAEAALRRLEGQVNASVQEAKSKKVDTWLKKVQERLAAQERGVDFSEEDEAAAARAEEDALEEGRDSDPDVAEAEVEDVTITRPPSFVAEPPDVDPPVAQDESEAVSEHPSTPLTEADEVSPINTGTSITPVPTESLVVPPPSQRAHSPLTTGIHSPRPPINYHSFILLYRSTALAHHFTLIDQDLFLSIKFDQLVSLEWARPVNELSTLDWELFLKDRQRLRVAARDHPDQNLQTISDVTAARTRFALMSAFIATEIILTNVNERHIITNKLIRVAWVGFYFPSQFWDLRQTSIIETLLDRKLFFSGFYNPSYTERHRPSGNAEELASCGQMGIAGLE
jgi:Gdp/GTP exchange factor required for growth at low temperatures